MSIPPYEKVIALSYYYSEGGQHLKRVGLTHFRENDDCRSLRAPYGVSAVVARFLIPPVPIRRTLGTAPSGDKSPNYEALVLKRIE